MKSMKTSSSSSSLPRKPIPMHQRSLEQILTSRLQTSSLLSAYALSQPPLEMLDLQKEREREVREMEERVVRNGSEKKYPGVSEVMVRSMKAGIVRMGGARERDRPHRLPREGGGRRGEQSEVFMDAFVGRPMTVGMDHTGRGGMEPAPGSESGSGGGMEESFPGAKGGRADTALSAPNAASFSSETSPLPPSESLLVTTLTKQCNSLAHRLVHVERELSLSRQAARRPEESGREERKRVRTAGGGREVLGMKGSR